MSRKGLAGVPIVYQGTGIKIAADLFFFSFCRRGLNTWIHMAFILLLLRLMIVAHKPQSAKVMSSPSDSPVDDVTRSTKSLWDATVER